MNGGMIDGALNAAMPQGEPTPDEIADESAPTPTPETENENEHEEETGHEEDNADETGEEDSANADTDDETEHDTPPVQNAQESPPIAENNAPADYADYGGLESVMIQNMELTAQLLDAERTNGVLLAILLAAVLTDIFWKRILR